MLPLRPPSCFLFYLHRTCWRKQNTSYISARKKGGEPPTQRMLITCVLSQAEPGHPLWIKGEIVSRSLIFHRPEMFSCSLSSGSCAREIIRAHFGQRNPSFSGYWTASPWLSWGHQCCQAEPPFLYICIVFIHRLFCSESLGQIEQGPQRWIF